MTDETYQVSVVFDAIGHSLAIGRPATIIAGDQVRYANPKTGIRDAAGDVMAQVRSSVTAPGPIAIIKFAKAYVAEPLSIVISDHSPNAAYLYVSQHSAEGFTVSTRRALTPNSIIIFDYQVLT